MLIRHHVPFLPQPLASFITTSLMRYDTLWPLFSCIGYGYGVRNKEKMIWPQVGLWVQK
jgi:hypothetical protein